MHHRMILLIGARIYHIWHKLYERQNSTTNKFSTKFLLTSTLEVKSTGSRETTSARVTYDWRTRMNCMKEKSTNWQNEHIVFWWTCDALSPIFYWDWHLTSFISFCLVFYPASLHIKHKLRWLKRHNRKCQTHHSFFFHYTEAIWIISSWHSFSLITTSNHHK